MNFYFKNSFLINLIILELLFSSKVNAECINARKSIAETDEIIIFFIISLLPRLLFLQKIMQNYNILNRLVINLIKIFVSLWYVKNIVRMGFF